MYVIQRTDQGGGFLAKQPVQGATYVHDIRKAEIFSTRDEADKARCPENEIVRSVSEILGANR